MKAMRVVLMTILLAGSALGAGKKSAAPAEVLPTPLTDELRESLLKAREAVWRAFFSPDARQIETALPPELIAIDEWQDKWRTRDDALADYRKLVPTGARLHRLEFPRTEFQVYGNTAVLYSLYLYEQEVNGRPQGATSGRATEVFVHRGGRWVNVGWHLDSGTHLVSREGLRQKLLAAREAVWRAEFSGDASALQDALAPGMMSLQGSAWTTRDEVLAARPASKLLRLEFPRTEIRIYGETAILYSSYVYEVEANGKAPGPVSGTATEIFVLRDGKWQKAGGQLAEDHASPAG
jgi:hypothetical protein